MSISDQDLIALGQRLEKESNAAHDLWTWLPSYAHAEKEHGDYAFNHQPSKADLMREAALFFAVLKRADREIDDEALDFFSCPCGEHPPVTKDEVVRLIRLAADVRD